MKVLVFGSDGFIGRNVCKELEENHEVIGASREVSTNKNMVQVDLLDENSVENALNNIRPEVVINCAGVVNSNLETDLNIKFTRNILEKSVQIGGIGRVIICGSAGEYGRVDPKNIPVNEDVPLNADSGYGLSKINEERLALEYKRKYKIGVVVLRIFNPIGKGMADKFLLMGLMRQVQECQNGERNAIGLSRLDAMRDYISIADVASAFRAIVEGNPSHDVYNVGTGNSTTNGELLELIIKNSKLEYRPKIFQTSEKPEPLVAGQADITLISDEFGWHPTHKIEDVIREIINDKN